MKCPNCGYETRKVFRDTRWARVRAEVIMVYLRGQGLSDAQARKGARLGWKTFRDPKLALRRLGPTVRRIWKVDRELEKIMHKVKFNI